MDLKYKNKYLKYKKKYLLLKKQLAGTGAVRGSNLASNARHGASYLRAPPQPPPPQPPPPQPPATLEVARREGPPVPNADLNIYLDIKYNTKLLSLGIGPVTNIIAAITPNNNLKETEPPNIYPDYGVLNLDLDVSTIDKIYLPKLYYNYNIELRRINDIIDNLLRQEIAEVDIHYEQSYINKNKIERILTSLSLIFIGDLNNFDPHDNIYKLFLLNYFASDNSKLNEQDINIFVNKFLKIDLTPANIFNNVLNKNNYHKHINIYIKHIFDNGYIFNQRRIIIKLGYALIKRIISGRSYYYNNLFPNNTNSNRLKKNNNNYDICAFNKKNDIYYEPFIIQLFEKVISDTINIYLSEPKFTRIITKPIDHNIVLIDGENILFSIHKNMNIQVNMGGQRINPSEHRSEQFDTIFTYHRFLPHNSSYLVFLEDIPPRINQGTQTHHPRIPNNDLIYVYNDCGNFDINHRPTNRPPVNDCNIYRENLNNIRKCKTTIGKNENDDYTLFLFYWIFKICGFENIHVLTSDKYRWAYPLNNHIQVNRVKLDTDIVGNPSYIQTGFRDRDLLNIIDGLTGTRIFQQSPRGYYTININ
jgi:hypothetical protein